MNEFYDLAIAWDWEYDRDFVFKIEEILQSKGLKTYRIEYHNVLETLAGLKKKNLLFGYFFNRSDEEEFYPVVKYLEKNACCFNQLKLVKKATDKATMHLEFITAGINVPNTIILNSYNNENIVNVPENDLAAIGRPFVIKPANETGGSMGVITGAGSVHEIMEARQYQKNDKYLVQEKVYPKIIAGKRAWFRGFYAFDKTFLTWWDDLTHKYQMVTEYEEDAYRLFSLRKIMATIRKVCSLDFFSSEICINNMNKNIVVDYVNEVCDMRLQSLHFDGVPDILVNQIVTRMSDFLKIKRD